MTITHDPGAGMQPVGEVRSAALAPSSPTSTSPTSSTQAPRFELLVDLLSEAAALPPRDGLCDVLELVTAAVEHDSLTPALAHRLGMQLRLVVGDHPVDGDVDTHLLLQSILSELAEITALVDGVHVEEIEPVIAQVLSDGDVAAARRMMLMAEAARVRVAALESSLRADLGVA